MKIDTVHDRAHVMAETDQFFSPARLLRIVGNPKGDVVNGPGSEPARRAVRYRDQVDRPAGSGFSRGSEPESIPYFLNESIAERLSQESSSALMTLDRGRDTMESPDRMFFRHRTVGPWLDFGGRR